MKYPQLVSMPSAVSNWLEEQLEARGIDAVVYTRYILSLLHSHTVDVIFSDEEFSHLKKEVGKWNKGRKRSRRSSSDWWRHAHADAEHIKRSAAVECLLSATDQNCEIESLVDELCEKLKEASDADLTASAPLTPTATPTTPPLRKITPQELAEKYYAAFPALCPSSPKKKGAGQRKIGGRQMVYENKLRVKENTDIMKARCQNKQRFPYFSRNKTTSSRHNNNNNNITNNTAVNNWDFNMFNNKKFFAVAPCKPKNLSEMHDSTDQCMEESRYLWANDGDDVNMYEDLPVDIKDLLDSPSPQQDTVEMMNMANMRDDGKREFIPYGTNIISSIWSTDQDVAYDNKFNSAIDNSANSDLSLGFKFSSISIGKPIQNWPIGNSRVEMDNVTNTLFENNKIFSLPSQPQRHLVDGFRSLPSDWNKPTEKNQKDKDSDNDNQSNHLACSLMKLNHHKEKSCFAEITPRSSVKINSFNPFGSNSGTFGLCSQLSVGSNKDKEDLLTSASSHFKPIVAEKMETSAAKKYADGATFVISNNLEKVDFKRSDSGTIWLESDNGQSKKYHEYKGEEIAGSPDPDFVLKFSICQNDKACQTEETADRDCEIFKGTSKIDDETNIRSGEDVKPDFSVGSDNVPLWKSKGCDECRRDEGSDWTTLKGVDWERDRGLRDIWSDGEMCRTCLDGGGELSRPAPSLRLREDISQDGEQLLSDLSTLQQSYMDDMPADAETMRDLSDLLSGPKERKRRHSFMLDHDAWSFASRLEEDCLIQMSTLPTLRSVTL